MEKNPKLELVEITGSTPEELLKNFLSFVLDSCTCSMEDEVEEEVEEIDPEELLKEAFIRVAIRKDWTIERTKRWIAGIEQINTLSAINILLKQIALLLDQQYKDHIRNSKELYYISTMTGEIAPITILPSVNFRTGAFFRTVKDAKLAKVALSEYFKKVGI